MLHALISTAPGESFVQFMRGPRGKKIDKFLVKTTGWSLLMTVFAAKVGYPPFPVLLLRTTGRRSGEERSTVMPYVLLNDTVYLIGSNGAKPKDPSWAENLRAHPDARILVRRRERRVHGREVPAETREYADVWARAAELTPQYDNYQRSTTRSIPIIALE